MFYKYSPIFIILTSYLFQGLLLNKLPLVASTSTPIKNSSVQYKSDVETTSNLIENNPFVPLQNSKSNESKSPDGPKNQVSKSQVLQKYLQFKSIAIINQKNYFSIFNKRTNKSFWISEKETIDNFRVLDYNQIKNTITITDGINAEIITLITANDTPLNVVSASANLEAQKSDSPPMPEANSSQQNKSKPKTPPRRRIVPVKRK